MKIFFEDGALRLAKAPIVAIAHVDAQNGATDCYNKLKQVKDKYGKKASAYTNSETALLNAAELSWNEEKEELGMVFALSDLSEEKAGGFDGTAEKIRASVFYK